MEQNWNA